MRLFELEIEIVTRNLKPNLQCIKGKKKLKSFKYRLFMWFSTLN